MINEIINTVLTFLKKEVSDHILEVEEGPEGKVAEKVHKWFLESGIYRAVLSEERGGAGLSERDVSLLLLEIGKIYASFAVWLLSHYVSVLFFERINKLFNENEVFGTNLFCGNYAFTSPFADRILCIREGRMSMEVPSSLKRVNVLGLKGCAVYEVKLSSEEIVDEGIVREMEAKGNLWVGAVSVGNALSSVESAVKYAHERYQGGDVIIKHGIIREMIGRMRAKVFASESMLMNICDKEDLRLKKLSKALITEMCEQVCCDGVQIFGGYGYMRDYGMERKFRDSKTLASFGGGNLRIYRDYIE